MLDFSKLSVREIEILLSTDQRIGLTEENYKRNRAYFERPVNIKNEKLDMMSGFFRNLSSTFSDLIFLLALFSALLCAVSVKTAFGYSVFTLLILYSFLSALLTAIAGTTSKNLSRLSAETGSISVIRNGIPAKIKAQRLVCGDLVSIGEGDIIPCEMRLCLSRELYVLESQVNKRVRPVKKNERFISAKNVQVPDSQKRNMLFPGSVVTAGQGLAIVISKNMEEEYASEILGNLSSEDEKYTLPSVKRSDRDVPAPNKEKQKKNKSAREELSELKYSFKLYGIICGVVTFIMLFALKASLAESFLIGTLIMAFPVGELYDLIYILSAAVGQKRLLKKQIVFRNIEALKGVCGAESFLCGKGILTSEDKASTPRSVISCKSAGIVAKLTLEGAYNKVLECAKESGVLSDGDLMINGDDMAAANDVIFLSNLFKYKLFLNLSVQQKQALVELMRENDETVGATLEKFTDISIGKEADCCFTLGSDKNASLKQVCDIYCEKEGFVNIQNAIKGARAIYKRMFSAVSVVLAMQIALFLFVILSGLFVKGNAGVGFSPFVTGVFAFAVCPLFAVCLSADDNSNGSITNTPQSFLNAFGIKARIKCGFLYGISLGLSGLFSFALEYLRFQNISRASSAAFLCLILGSIFSALSLRDRSGVFKSGFFSVTLLYLSFVLCFCTFLILQIPRFRLLFGFDTVDSRLFLTSVLCSLIPFIVGEAEKLIINANGKK